MDRDTTKERVILIIEDDDDHFASIQRLLKKTSFARWGLRRAATFEQAIDALRSETPALILCDQKLPDSDAHETLSRIVERAPEDAAVVAMTSLPEGPRARAAMRAGVQDYLVKGEHDADRLERSLYYALDRKQILGELHARNRELENFVRIVSHDLKSPLGAVMLEAQLLELAEPHPTENVRRMIEGVRNGCKSMTEIIDSLLAYARAGWMVGDDIEPICPTQSVKGAIRQLAADIQRQGVFVDVQTLPPILGTQRAATQIFQNLIGNAIRYNESAAPRISIGGEQRDGMVVISVADNGVGISAEQIATVFEMFTSFGKKGGAGSGLGLAIVRRLVTLLKGGVSVQSEVGKGSTFHVAFPAAPAGAIIKCQEDDTPLPETVTMPRSDVVR